MTLNKRMKKEQLEQLNESTSEEKKLMVINLVEGLEALNFLIVNKLPVFTGFKLTIFLKAISPVLEAYNKEKDALVKEYGTPTLDENGKETGKYNFDADKAKEFNEKMKPLLEAEVDVKVPEIKIADLGDIKMDVNQISSIAWLLKE
jgi:hypothetical protein